MSEAILGKAFEVEISEEAIRGWLQERGFVHITGLPYRDPGFKDDDGFPKEGTVQPARGEIGRLGYNNGKTVVVTTIGEVWLAAGSPDVPFSIYPNGRGVFVPMSNTDVVDAHCLLRRVRDPNWPGHNGEFSPVPCFRH